MSNRWTGGFIQAYFDPLTMGPATGPGNLYAWGRNAQGQIGNDTIIDASSPIQIGSTLWSDVGSCGNSSSAIKSDGTLWCWGQGAQGKTAQNDEIDLSSPVQVGALTTWSKVDGGSNHFTAIKADGTIWAWGSGTFGQLGDGEAVRRSSPVQIGALTTWSTISAGGSTTAAIKNDGTLWAWGSGGSGQLGQNDLTSRSSPVQVGAGTDWAHVYAGYYNSMMAIKTDGTLWAIGGQNSFGQLALPGANTISYSSPTQIGALTNWQTIAAGTAFCIANKTDGTLWGWGIGSSGELGVNNGITYSSPIQIGSDTDWGNAKIASYTGTLVVKADTTLWAWGTGSYGRLGINSDVKVSSPTQVGSGASWVVADISNVSSLAISE